MTKEESEEMRKVFSALDLNNDGLLTKDELVFGLELLGCKNPEEQADRLYDLVDYDGSGEIEFTEWCTACMDKKQLLKRNRLRAAFNMFDVDMGGTITLDEIRGMLSMVGSSEGNQQFKDMVKEMDEDGDGEIDFKEFEIIMNQIMFDEDDDGD